MKSYISDALCRHSASLQLRSHSYGYAPSVVPRIVPAQVARNIRFHMASYLNKTWMRHYYSKVAGRNICQMSENERSDIRKNLIEDWPEKNLYNAAQH